MTACRRAFDGRSNTSCASAFGFSWLAWSSLEDGPRSCRSRAPSSVPGNLVVQSNVKNIQHPTGGIVAEIDVQDGSRVQTGELLLRLDATQGASRLANGEQQLDELGAKIARLVAERDGLARIEVPAELASRSANETVKSRLASGYRCSRPA